MLPLPAKSRTHFATTSIASPINKSPKLLLKNATMMRFQLRRRSRVMLLVSKHTHRGDRGSAKVDAGRVPRSSFVSVIPGVLRSRLLPRCTQNRRLIGHGKKSHCISPRGRSALAVSSHHARFSVSARGVCMLCVRRTVALFRARCSSDGRREFLPQGTSWCLAQ